MKPFKKLFLSLLICTMVVAMLGSTALAAETISNEDMTAYQALQGEIDISNIELGKKVVLPDGAVLTEISKDEYVSRLAKEKNISLQEAYRIESNNLVNSDNIIYYSYTKNYVYNWNYNFSADLLATIKLYSSGSFREIRNVMGVGSRVSSGLYDYSWVEIMAWSDPDRDSKEFPTMSVALGASGYFQVIVDSSVSVNLPGFIGITVGGSTTYTSNTVNMQGTYRVY